MEDGSLGQRHLPPVSAGDRTYDLIVRIKVVDEVPHREHHAWPDVLRKFGFMPIAEAEEMVSWCLEQLSRESLLEIKQALALQERFPNLLAKRMARRDMQ